MGETMRLPYAAFHGTRKDVLTIPCCVPAADMWAFLPCVCGGWYSVRQLGLQLLVPGQENMVPEVGVC